ncbi:hypothetical protein AVEN_238006-1 [Araneus ventricosus]|uniref:Uncharacterized protein n=1 Tax=Araneus ventricosus TaxID=182803 RepID=A0A4Y2EFG9_ARAVE|nr:hypothetical protein AVEN_238006-1 [Araneus ventricosus]
MVGGRLAQSLILDQKHPMLLPSRHIITRLLIRSFHERHFHAGIIVMDFASPFLIKPNLPRSPWIHEVVPIPVHVHPHNTIGNVTLQTRQRVSSHQQPNSGAGCPKRGVKLCAVQSTMVHEWAFVSESPYQ